MINCSWEKYHNDMDTLRLLLGKKEEKYQKLLALAEDMSQHLFENPYRDGTIAHRNYEHARTQSREAFKVFLKEPK